jgi:formylglycine-generating enzyme required for sulfatase activity
MDEDGAYSDVDIDDNDASVNIPPVANQSPTSLTAAEEQLSQGDTLTNTLATDVDLEVIYLEPGAYPPSTILTKGFYMGKYEVTQAQYEAVMTGNTDGLSATPSHFSNNPNRPVEWISWESVQIFLTRLNAQQSANIPSGWKYVLPTEAQWEYACRAGTTTAYSWGNSITSADANYGYNVNETTDVGSYAANPWGLFDMHGNVYEWCSDWWTHIPPSGYDPEGPATSTIGYRVKRGGFWGTSGTNLTSAKRFGDPPTFRNNNTGFRVALIQVTAPDANKSPTSLTAAPAPVANQSPTSLTAAEQPVAPSVGPTILTHTVIPYTPLTFVDISAATFFIGAPSDNSALKSQYQYYPSAANLGGARVDDTYGGANENYREVTLTEDYKMATTPVTRAQYLHVMSGYAGHIGELDTVAYGANPPSVKPDNFNVPVHYVSWLDAQEFVDRLNTQEPVAGWEYVLPTEAQWEYACKAVNKNQIDAGTHWYTKYWLGDTLTQADANYDATQSELAEVQQYNPNAFGLYDLIGGVKEWTSDIYASNYVDYSSDYTPLTDPAGGASYKTYDNMTQKGGLWRQTAPQVRSASRAYGGKTMKGYGTGFRVAMVPSP